MADLTPYSFPDGDGESQERFVEQQIAVSAQARRVTNGERSVERQPIGDLIRFDRYQEEKRNRASRIRSVLSRHAKH